ncbi:hypothetical protein D3C73_1078570 [compost metagenome]
MYQATLSFLPNKIVIVLEAFSSNLLSLLLSSLSGLTISIACGVDIDVVKIKNVTKRNIKSTIGVISTLGVAFFPPVFNSAIFYFFLASALVTNKNLFTFCFCKTSTIFLTTGYSSLESPLILTRIGF